MICESLWLVLTKLICVIFKPLIGASSFDKIDLCDIQTFEVYSALIDVGAFDYCPEQYTPSYKYGRLSCDNT